MSATLVLLPGLGADPRLFEPQKRAVPDLISIDWPEAHDGESLVSYAERLVPLVPRRDPLVLGGSSFGGMVALELAARLSPSPRAVILIGSCRSPRALAPWIRSASPLLRAAPAALYRPRRWGMTLAEPFFRFGGRETRDLVFEMVRAFDPRFLKWGVRAIFAWKPGPASVPVHHVHGADDHIIPARRVEADRVIPGAGHLLTLTHADAVNAFLTETLRPLMN